MSKNGTQQNSSKKFRSSKKLWQIPNPKNQNQIQKIDYAEKLHIKKFNHREIYGKKFRESRNSWKRF